MRCSKEVIAGLDDKDILQRGSRTTFKHLKEKFQTQSKSEREKNLDKQFKRRDGRKKTVCCWIFHARCSTEIFKFASQKSVVRTAVRDQYPNLQHARYDFIFHPAWQSTDCSTDITSASDGDSLDDGEGPKFKKLKSWPPDYRDADVSARSSILWCIQNGELIWDVVSRACRRYRFPGENSPDTTKPWEEREKNREPVYHGPSKDKNTQDTFNSPNRWGTEDTLTVHQRRMGRRASRSIGQGAGGVCVWVR